MKSDTEVRLDGMRALLESLGEVDAERFIALMNREAFDYTQWQQRLWEGIDLRTLSASAMNRRLSGKE